MFFAQMTMNRRRRFAIETLESRQLFAADCNAVMHNAALPEDVNADQAVTPLDALMVINFLNTRGRDTCITGEGETFNHIDVNNDQVISPLDALLVVNHLNALASSSEADRRDPSINARLTASLSDAELLGAQNLLTGSDVETLLKRASQASPSTDAIIAIVDRTGRILGVRVEAGVAASIKDNPDKLAFAIDGAVAKARTAAFFSSNAAPLTSRTIRFISQSTNTQREIESSPLNADPRYNGPGFVAPIGVGGHFPPEIPYAPQVDLFAIEHQSRDRQLLAGVDGVFGTSDDINLLNRFNVHPLDIADASSKPTSAFNVSVKADEVFDQLNADEFFQSWPESFGVQAGTSRLSQARGIATLPGGVPLYKAVTYADGTPVPIPAGKTPALPEVNLVGGIGVFFPGEDGFATYEQDFVHTASNGGVTQLERERLNAPRALESEFIALAASAGGGIKGTSAFTRDIPDINRQLAALPNFVALNGRIDLVGITLEIYGPTPRRESPLPGIDQLLALGRSLGPLGVESGSDVKVQTAQKYLEGQAVPEEWLVVPHAASDGSLTAAQVEQIIRQGIAEADLTRAAIRLDVNNNFKPGARTRMVFAVADTNGELLGLYRMPDATVFSIDVAIAKARNTAYYADAQAIVDADRIDFNNDGVFGPIATSLTGNGDTVPKGTALSNRTFRFLVEPRYPTGAELPEAGPAPQSVLNLPGINPGTAENTDSLSPLAFSIYADENSSSTTAFDAFVPSRNFRDLGDDEVTIAGTGIEYALANQNGVVFFPGSSPLYRSGKLVGGFGVSGDGVDQDDVVTAAGQVGFAAPDHLRIDQYIVGGVRLPFQKYNRNPLVA
jgi:uncharacterized protein GlcG (DUF336 family)